MRSCWAASLLHVGDLVAGLAARLVWAALPASRLLAFHLVALESVHGRLLLFPFGVYGWYGLSAR